jgi:2',3'-cyclic-nucleotide 2'-phosphodiesterase (5'-nucleotidase family)
VKSSSDAFTYVEGDTLHTLILDGGDTLQYTFTVDSLTEGEATLTFTKI